MIFNAIEIIALLFIHWVADFLLQTKDMAMNKSKDNYWLFVHVSVYSLTWLFIGIFFYDIKAVYLFTLTTFVAHFATDYITSRWTSKLRIKEKYYGFPSFFSVIGLDQLLHYIQLIFSYGYFKSL
jgi:undecaprenyl pyrophosphate phosphatase UppP